jgi:hypothetical protein
MGTDLILTIDISRNTTRTEYKEIQHWRRDCKRIINERVELAMCEMLIYGTVVI